MAFRASGAELSLLWDAITDTHHLPRASDGHRRWAWLVDLSTNWVSTSFDGFSGAIVIAEDGIGAIAATLHDSSHDLHVEWHRIFSEVR